MIILAIDMSGDNCSIAISNHKNILAESSTFARMRHLPKIMPQIDFTLKQANIGIKDVELLCAVSGPGSWTGIRIAITMIKVFSHTLSIPCITVNSLESLACNLRFVNPIVYSILDAARHQVYCAGYNCEKSIPETIETPSLKPIHSFLDHMSTPAILLGDATIRYAEIISQHSEKEILLAPSTMNQINISHVIEIGYEKFLTNGSDDIHELSPVYLQQTDAERNLNKNR